MRREDFRIGLEFWCDGRRWRCIDLGTRVVVAVCLEARPGERDGIEPGAEHLFHPYDLSGCTLGPLSNG